MTVAMLCPGCQKKLTGRNPPTLERRVSKHLEACVAGRRWATASYHARAKRKALTVAALVAGLASASGCLAWFLGAFHG